MLKRLGASGGWLDCYQGHVISGTVVRLEHMSGFTALMQPWSLLIPMAPNTTEDRLYIVGPTTHRL